MGIQGGLPPPDFDTPDDVPDDDDMRDGDETEAVLDEVDSGEPEPAKPAPKRKEPDTSPVLDEPRGVVLEDEDPESGAAIDIGGFHGPRVARLDGPVHGRGVADIASKLAALGDQIQFRLQRIEPDDMPSTEYGLSGWIAVRGRFPNPEQIRQHVYDKFGGGKYEVTLKSIDVQRQDEVGLILSLQGDPKPISSKGQQWLYRQQLAAAGGIPMAMGGTGNAEVAGLGDAATVVTKALDVLTHKSDQEHESKEREKSREHSASVEAMRMALEAVRPKGDGVNAIAAALTSVVPLVMQVMQQNAAARELSARTEREARERAEERMEARFAELLKMQRPETPPDAIKAMEAVVGIVKRKGELEMESFAEHQKVLTKAMVETLRGQGREEEASFWDTMGRAFAERAPDLVAKLPQMLASMQSQRRAVPMPSQQPAPQMPVPMPPGQQQPAPLPPAPQGAQPVPMPGTEPPAPAQAAAPAPEEPPVFDPVAIGVRMSHVALRQFLQHTMVCSQNVWDPDTSWSWLMAGQTATDWFGVCPVTFRRALMEANPNDERFAFSFVNAMSGLADEVSLQYAKALDESLQADAQKEWLRAWIEAAPWYEGGEEGDEDADD